MVIHLAKYACLTHNVGPIHKFLFQYSSNGTQISLGRLKTTRGHHSSIEKIKWMIHCVLVCTTFLFNIDFICNHDNPCISCLSALYV